MKSCDYRVTVPEYGIDETFRADSARVAAEAVLTAHGIDAVFEPVRALVSAPGEHPRAYLVRAFPVFVYEAEPEPEEATP